MLRASVAAEQAGIPSVTLIGSRWQAQAQGIRRALGAEAMPIAVCPGDLMLPNEGYAAAAPAIADQVVSGLTRDISPAGDVSQQPRPDEIVLAGSFDEVNEQFYARGWSDGLPVVPPTVARVEAFQRHTRRRPGEILGVLLPDRRELTVWNVAVAGVMAGCAPRYMPVLLAAAEALADPRFRIEDYGAGPGWEPIIVVSGPAIEEFEFNSGPGVMKTGRHANTTVGRFLRLVIWNIAGLKIPPAGTDLACFGNPFNPALAEDEAHVRSLGWPTFGQDRGLAAGQSGVTVQGVVGMSPPIFATPDTGRPEDLLANLVDIFGRAMCGWWTFTGALYGQWHPLVLVNQVVATRLTEAGWTKDDVRRHLYESCRIPASVLERRGAFLDLDIARNVEQGILPASYLESRDPDRLVPIFVRQETIGVAVAGRPIGTYQRGLMQSHEQGAPVTRPLSD